MAKAKHSPHTLAELQSLAAGVRKLDAVFCCGGQVLLPGPVELGFRTGRAIRVIEEGFARSRDIGKLLMQRCAPAPFGVGRETRVDPRVRNGGQLLAVGGAFNVWGIDLDDTGILRAIHRALCPADATPPKAELYALNVYRPRGHFVKHKDTPRDPDVFGTLVACLPVRFGGGRLVLRHEATRSYDWAPPFFGFNRMTDEYKVDWAAFYGDVDHEIEPVTDGTRVTLTWLLRRSSAEVVARKPESGPAEFEAALARALADPHFLPQGGVLGTPCLHLYPEASNRARRSNALSRAAASGLKGRDRDVALAAIGAGLDVRYRPYLYETSACESWRLARAPTKAEAAIFSDDRLDDAELERALPIERHAAFDDPDDVTWLVPPSWDDSTGKSVDDPDTATEFLGELEYSATGYFGNEAGDAAFYMAAALLIVVPPKAERAPSAQRAVPKRRRT